MKTIELGDRGCLLALSGEESGLLSSSQTCALWLGRHATDDEVENNVSASFNLYGAQGELGEQGVLLGTASRQENDSLG
jgi:hypothetical protein